MKENPSSIRSKRKSQCVRFSFKSATPIPSVIQLSTAPELYCYSRLGGSTNLHGVLSQNVFIFSCRYVCKISKGLLKNACSVLLSPSFSLKSCFQFHNNAFNQAGVLKADVRTDLIFHSLYAHSNTHACTGIFYANAENRGIYFALVYGAEY